MVPGHGIIRIEFHGLAKGCQGALGIVVEKSQGVIAELRVLSGRTAFP